MSLRGRIQQWLAPKASTPGWTDLSPLAQMLRQHGFGGETSAGIEVTNWSAMQLSTYFACQRNISEDVAVLPFFIYARNGRNRERLQDHPLTRMLHYQPNDEMDALTFRQTLQSHILCWGNGFAEIQRDIAGNIVALWPIRPDRVRAMKREPGTRRIYYEIMLDSGETVKLAASRVLHIPGIGYDGLVGYNVTRYAKEALAYGLVLEKFGCSFFSRGATQTGVITADPGLDFGPTTTEKLRKMFEEEHAGIRNAHGVPVLPPGMKFTPTTIPPETAQFLASRRFGVIEICRWFRMPPHKVSSLEQATNNNIEHQALEYYTDTLRAPIARWEQAIWRQLLTPEEKARGLYAHHVVEGLLRGDMLTRYRAHAVGIQTGFLSRDEVREMEDRNPIPGGQGGEFLVPLNMGAATSGERKIGTAKAQAMQAMIADCARRIAAAERRELTTHGKACGESDEQWRAWCAGFYERLRDYAGKVIAPLNCFIWELDEWLDGRLAMVTQWERPAEAVESLGDTGETTLKAAIEGAVQ